MNIAAIARKRKYTIKAKTAKAAGGAKNSQDQEEHPSQWSTKRKNSLDSGSDKTPAKRGRKEKDQSSQGEVLPRTRNARKKLDCDQEHEEIDIREDATLIKSIG